MPPRAKDAALVLLVLANLILLCTVLAHVLHLPQANAQVPERPPVAEGTNRFLAVSALIGGGGANALFVLDTLQQRLYTWAPQSGVQGVNMILREVRDLRADFARQPSPAVPPRAR